MSRVTERGVSASLVFGGTRCRAERIRATCAATGEGAPPPAPTPCKLPLSVEPSGGSRGTAGSSPPTVAAAALARVPPCMCRCGGYTPPPPPPPTRTDTRGEEVGGEVGRPRGEGGRAAPPREITSSSGEPGSSLGTAPIAAPRKRGWAVCGLVEHGRLARELASLSQFAMSRCRCSAVDGRPRARVIRVVAEWGRARARGVLIEETREASAEAPPIAPHTDGRACERSSADTPASAPTPQPPPAPL